MAGDRAWRSHTHFTCLLVCSSITVILLYHMMTNTSHYAFFEIITHSLGSKHISRQQDANEYDSASAIANHTPHKRKNMLFIISDDMRAQLEPYTDKESVFTSPPMVTPNLKRLASTSLLLKNAFVQYTLCGPSRTSMLTSRTPDTTRVYHNKDYWREVGGNFTTLPQLFKESGYRTLCFGKVFHVPSKFSHDYPASWSKPCGEVDSTEPFYKKGAKPGGIWRAVGDKEMRENPLDDHVMIEQVKTSLRQVSKESEPFFLAVGFRKPHLPFICPQRYFDEYPLELEKHYLSKIEWQTPTVRKGCNVANTTRVEKHFSKLDEQTLRHYRRAYFGCISYVDSLIGELLDTLDELNLRDSTIISFTADHGYHLGENGLFGKQTLLDIGSRVPMMVSVPGLTDRAVVSSTPVESLDLFPTLAEAAGLSPVPQCPRNSSHVKLCTQGRSLLPLIDDPDTSIDTVAQTQVRPVDTIMQYSIRNDRYRYIQSARAMYVHNITAMYELTDESTRFPPELYDHAVDREETRNVWGDPGYLDVAKLMRRQLHEMWQKSN